MVDVRRGGENEAEELCWRTYFALDVEFVSAEEPHDGWYEEESDDDSCKCPKGWEGD